MVFILILIILPVSHTVPHVLMAPENPDGEIPFPLEISTESQGFVLIVLDGVGSEYFLNSDLMPGINSHRHYSATVDITTGPLTLSATCISEMMTGVPNAPINGLRNFDLKHPGNSDPWLLAANDSRYEVGIVGSYVMGNLYDDFNKIDFENTFKGHSDYYEGDKDTLDVATEWLAESRYNVMAVHFSGPDKVGHTWGADSPEYENKLVDVDSQVSALLESIPKNWSIVITADHGMTDMGTHGSAEDVTRDVTAIISGPQIMPGATADSHQRDLSAIMPLLLGLPFPVQLHGRIPLDIFDYSDNDKMIIEQWNWEAAYERQQFFDESEGSKKSQLSLEEIDWKSIPADGEFSRPSDVYISIFTWTLIAVFVILGLGLSKRDILQDWKIFTAFIGCIVISLFSHAMLNYSAMIPRAIGGLCSVWLVGYSLSNLNHNENSSKFSSILKRSLHSPLVWFSTTFAIGVIFWSALVAVVSSLLIYSILYSLYSSLDKSVETKSKSPIYLPWILSILCMTYGSIRLWYALIPLFFILVGMLLRTNEQEDHRLDKLPIISVLILTFFAVFFIHHRIFGENYILEAVEKGWPSNLQSMVVPSLLLILTSTIATITLCKSRQSSKSVALSIWLNYGLIVSIIESTYLDIFTLVMVLCLYSFAIYKYFSNSDSGDSIEYSMAAISMQLLLTWGAWSVFASLLLLTCSGRIWGSIIKNRNMKLGFSNPNAVLAMAVFPWAIWILWWTLLGQVNGLQTCFEGICPHPRELDPGSVIVRGGYVGSRDDPNLYWMVFMVSSPIIITSMLMMNTMRNNGLNLYPYIVFQALIILGCISVIGFSPEYPRLVFSLTWNIFFAAFQMIIGSAVHLYGKKVLRFEKEINVDQSIVVV